MKNRHFLKFGRLIILKMWVMYLEFDKHCSKGHPVRRVQGILGPVVHPPEDKHRLLRGHGKLY